MIHYVCLPPSGMKRYLFFSVCVCLRGCMLECCAPEYVCARVCECVPECVPECVSVCARVCVSVCARG